MNKTILQVKPLIGDEYEILYILDYKPDENNNYPPIRYDYSIDKFEVLIDEEWIVYPHYKEKIIMNFNQISSLINDLQYTPVYNGDTLIGMIPDLEMEKL